MAKTSRKSGATALRDWNEVDSAMRRIAEAMLAKETIENEMKSAILEAETRGSKLGKPLVEAIAAYREQIEEFVSSSAKRDSRSAGLSLACASHAQAVLRFFRRAFRRKKTTTTPGRIGRQVARADVWQGRISVGD